MDDALLRFGGFEVSLWSVTGVKRGELAGSEGNKREGFVNAKVIDTSAKFNEMNGGAGGNRTHG